MRTHLRYLFFSLALVCIAGTGLAQQEIPQPPARLGKLTLDVVVSGKNGKPVAGMTQQDFTLLDNKEQRPITSFRALDRTEPVKVILLVDAVNANYQNVSYVRQQLDTLLKSNGGKLDHPTQLAFFTDQGTQIQKDFTTDGNALSALLDQYEIGLRTIRRSAGFFGAEDRYQLSVTTLHQLVAAEQQQPGRKLVLWISPGWPLLSGPGIYLDGKEQEGVFHDVVEMSTGLHRSRMTLYAVDPLGAGQSVLSATYYQTYEKGISKAGQAEIADTSLQVLAKQSGGLVLTSNNDVASMLARCLDDTSAYYELTFDAAPADKADEYHHIEIKVATPGLTARTRDGYYAQP
ncbi:MAG TPA: VWA domain-containing protein [Granulicella sp.]